MKAKQLDHTSSVALPDRGVTVRPRRRRRRPPTQPTVSSTTNGNIIDNNNDDDDDDDIRILQDRPSWMNVPSITVAPSRHSLSSSSSSVHERKDHDTVASSTTTHHCTTPTTASTSSSRCRRPRTTTTTGTTATTTASTNTTTICRTVTPHPMTMHDELIQQFRTAVQRIYSSSSTSSSSSSVTVSIWSQHPALIPQVVRTSMSLPTVTMCYSNPNIHPRGTNQRNDQSPSSTSIPPITSLLLEDCAMELLSTCRTLVKEVTESNDTTHQNNTKIENNSDIHNQNTNTKDDRFLVAVHGLRAILCTHTIQCNEDHHSKHPNPVQTSKYDTIRRLLYFCLLHRPIHDSNHSVSYLAYQAFGYTLQGYTWNTTMTSKSDRMAICASRTRPTSAAVR